MALVRSILTLRGISCVACIESQRICYGKAGTTICSISILRRLYVCCKIRGPKYFLYYFWGSLRIIKGPTLRIVEGFRKGLYTKERFHREAQPFKEGRRCYPKRFHAPKGLLYGIP